MILQALYDYYQRKSASEKGSIAPEGWVCRGVDYAIIISDEGLFNNIEQRFTIEKNKIISNQVFLPAIGKQAMKHTNSGKDANLLWDNAGFVLGLGGKGQIKVASFIQTINEWFDVPSLNDRALSAVRGFYNDFDNNRSRVLAFIDSLGFSKDFEKRDPIMAFCLLGDRDYVHTREKVKSAYELKITNVDPNAPRGNCLVTGKANTPIVLNETVIKNVWGGQSSGTNIISFNKRSFESYGKSEKAGENAPVSIEASSAYTSALNYLLSSAQRMQVGDASTIFWADREDPLEDNFTALWGVADTNKDDPDRNANAVNALYKAVEEHGRKPALGEETRFYILGLAAPAKARLSVRFWHTGTVREVGQRIVDHFDYLKIDHSERDREFLPLWLLLESIALLGKRENIPPALASEVIRRILEGLPYPQNLLSLAVQRIRAEQSKKDKNTGKSIPNITYPRAALIKACINSQYNQRETVNVSLDPEEKNEGYRLGRLFAVLERIQEEAHRDPKTKQVTINSTIRDRYYSAASAAPVTVFQTLLRLKNHHLSKLDRPDQRRNFEIQLGSILDGLPTKFKKQLNLEDQGRFAIGYYHQRQDFFKKREKTTETENTQPEIETGAQGELL
ncbi:MAG: type I-C CRISPR-associated protein Cas8c/Csd1 [Gammaproteobacteria bacterium]|nr:type I-C CRISPR-associated protein Cas8c/Csd1 [Gammaproteobacteria bacterium]